MISTHTIRVWHPKLLWLVLPSVLGGAAWWYGVADTLQGHVAFTQARLVYLVGFFALMIVCLGLWIGAAMISVYLVRLRYVRAILALVTTSVIWFFFPLSIWTAIAAALCWAGVWWGMEQAAGDAHNRLTVQPYRTISQNIGLVLIAIMAAVSLLYYQQLRGSTTTADQLATRLTDQTVQLAERFLPFVYKGYRPDMTVDQLINAQFPTADSILQDIDFEDTAPTADQVSKLRDRLSQLDLNPDEFTVNNQATRDQIVAQLNMQLNVQRDAALVEVRDELSKQLGVPIRGDEPVRQVISDLVNIRFDKYAKQYVEVIPWLLSLALFFVLRVVSGLLLIGVTIMSWVLYRLLRLGRIVEITHQTVPAEQLEWTH